MGLAAGLLAVNLAVVAFAHTHYTRTPWREMARAIEDAAATPPAWTAPPGPRAMPGHRSTWPSARSAGTASTMSVWTRPRTRPDSPARVRPQFLKLDDALQQRQPFVVLMLVYMGPTHPDGMRQELEQATPGYACRQLYWQTFYQEPYTSMPTPFMRHSAEVWLCVPRPNQPPLKRTRREGDKVPVTSNEIVELSVVVPCYNEESVLGELHRRLTATIEPLEINAEVILVNDGSRDGTWPACWSWRQPTRGWSW